METVAYSALYDVEIAKYSLDTICYELSALFVLQIAHNTFKASVGLFDSEFDQNLVQFAPVMDSCSWLCI